MFILFSCFTSYTFLRVREQEGEYMHAVLCCCSCPLCVCVMGGGGGGGVHEYCEENSYFTLGYLNTVKRIVTLQWNQTNLIYI